MTPDVTEPPQAPGQGSREGSREINPTHQMEPTVQTAYPPSSPPPALGFDPASDMSLVAAALAYVFGADATLTVIDTPGATDPCERCDDATFTVRAEVYPDRPESDPGPALRRVCAWCLVKTTVEEVDRRDPASQRPIRVEVYR